MTSLIGKARRPKFELHLKIYDLNNVPLVSGSSFIKWHLAHSMHAEHRGRTSKCAIANHRVDYSFSKHLPSIRISMDKNNRLTECPIEFEILQEFAHAEKITLGHIKLNLSEFVAESEAFVKEFILTPKKRRSSHGVPPTSAPKMGDKDKHDHVEDGIIRRYLMQDSKVNSTLKIGILMVQLDGDRNFIAPSLKTAPVFGGIAGHMATEQQVEDEPGSLPGLSKSRDVSEMHDLYRRTLAAFWFSQPSEVPADECIEDIFSGGNGWKTKQDANNQHHNEPEDPEAKNGTLRPRDFRRLTQQYQHSPNPQEHHRRANSSSSEKSISTVTGRAAARGGASHRSGLRMVSDCSREPRSAADLNRDRSGSLASLTPTLGSERSRNERGFGMPHEVPESEVRDDLVAWTLPGA